MYHLCMSSKAFNITLPLDLVKQLDKVAKSNYMSRSDFIRGAVFKELKTQTSVWEEVVDFTKINKDGVSGQAILKALKTLK